MCEWEKKTSTLGGCAAHNLACFFAMLRAFRHRPIMSSSRTGQTGLMKLEPVARKVEQWRHLSLRIVSASAPRAFRMEAFKAVLTWLPSCGEVVILNVVGPSAKRGLGRQFRSGARAAPMLDRGRQKSRRSIGSGTKRSKLLPGSMRAITQ